jgi:primosomal protein N' (replication factor Y)
VVGVQRTAEEIGRAFPGTKVIISSAEKLVLEVPDEPSLVLATPQAEPKAVGGYAAAVILDADKSLGRAELRVGEESLRRWLAVTALVRPAASQGTVLIVGDAAERTVQALLRLDPVGYSERELAERSAASLPPGVKLVSFTGDEPTLFSALEHLELPAGVTVVGPYPLEYGDAPSSAPPAKDASARLNLISPLDQAADLVAAVKLMLAKRSSRKLPGSFRCQVDPQIVS